ncbi:MAG: hypothetical protein J6Z03_03595 [Erysipelotrichaceae bacterium]|nr:hypothetical protein [Erysipelotrichaceae bacterium]
MYKLKEDKGRISLIEMVALVLLIPMLAFLGYKGLHWYYDNIVNGNDAHFVNTAESTARVNSLNGMQCPVDGGGGNNCHHLFGDYYRGYYDSISHKIVGEKMEGYNQAETMKAGNTYYHGDVGTMIIEIDCQDGVIELKWVKGK